MIQSRRHSALESVANVAIGYGVALASQLANAVRRWFTHRTERIRPCTCHPDDRPPGPCPRRYAASECQQAAVRP
jgi:hypothetical protein